MHELREQQEDSCLSDIEWREPPGRLGDYVRRVKDLMAMGLFDKPQAEQT